MAPPRNDLMAIAALTIPENPCKEVSLLLHTKLIVSINKIQSTDLQSRFNYFNFTSSFPVAACYP